MLQTSEARALKVLFVEDDTDHFDYFTHLLRQLDKHFSLDRSSSLEAALDKLSSDEFDLILLDVGLPDSVGLSTLENVISRTESPVVILSASEDGDLAREAIRFGAQDFLVKSEVTSHSLGRAVLYAVDRIHIIKTASEAKQTSNEFLRTISHDLRAPLARLANLTQIFKQEFGPELQNPEAIDFLSDIEDEARNLTYFIQHLYSFCKGDNTRGKLHLQPISLATPLLRSLAVLGEQIDRQKARICLGPMPVLSIDQALIAHVFQNLVSNSLKFCGSRRPMITIEAVCHPSKCVVTVSDNGVGLAVEDLDNVFEPFFRSNATATFEGSGIGLAFCKKVITCHGGRIWASESRDGGCVISFTIPIRH